MSDAVDRAQALRTYADQVIFRAYVAAKKRIKLSKTPFKPEEIKVSIGNTALPADKWEYDASSNEVVIKWHLIDFATIKPGDKIKIEYRA